MDRPPAAEPSHAERARVLVAGSTRGALATLAVEPAGHPFASLVAYAADGAGRPVLLLSALAEHTRNARADPRASLLVTRDGPAAGDPLAGERVTLVGRLLPVTGEAAAHDARATYLSAHPQAARYAGYGDFAFHRLAVASVRYVGGFGRMGWVDASAYTAAGLRGEARPSPAGRKAPMSDITVTPMGPGEFGVQVSEGNERTSHKVTVPDELLDDLALPDLDQQVLVEESFAFLLEREPATSIMREFPLTEISRHFPEYEEELRRRLS